MHRPVDPFFTLIVPCRPDSDTIALFARVTRP